MKFGFSVPVLSLYSMRATDWERHASADDFIRVIQRADALGYDWLAFADHIAIPKEWEPVFGPRWTEVTTAMSFAAGATRKIRLLSYVLIVPYRNPLIAAKEIASLDFLSNGRVILGVGTGHMEREFKLLGVPYAERGPITDEYLAAMRELWTSDSPRFSGKYCSFEDICVEPKPKQDPLPIWVGGNQKIGVRRAARAGNGWMPWIADPESLKPLIGYLHEQIGDAERSRNFDVIVPVESMKVEANRAENRTQKPIGVSGPLGTSETIDYIGQLSDAGVTGVQVPIGKTASAGEFIERIEAFAADVIPKFRG